MNYYFEVAMKEAIKSLKSNDVPVGAVIVKDNKIIAKGHNERLKKNSAEKHAEILTIIKACKKLKNWNLNDCEMYVTLKPCSMCESFINNARISKVYYLLEKPVTKCEFKSNYHKIQTNVCTEIMEKYQKIFTDFFKKLRNK